MTSPSSMTDELLAQLQGAPMQQMAQQLGASSAQVQSAVGAAVPMLLAALGRNSSQPQGAAALLGALQRDHSQAASAQGAGGIGGLLGSLLGGGGGGGGAILGHILGSGQQQAMQNLGQTSGLGGNAGQLLTLLAPIVMSFLAQRVQAGQLDASTLGQSLGRERAQLQQQGGGADLLAGLLDQNGDGKLDAGDLLKFGAGLLGGRR